MDINIYRPGTQGYAPRGATGEKGAAGYSLHYTSYSMEDDVLIIDNLVSNNKPLSNKINENVYVQYSENDTIIDKYAMMYTMSLNTDPSVNMTYTYTYIGNIINQTENENASTKITIDNAGLVVDKDIHFSITDYVSRNDNNPFHKHRSTQLGIKGFELKLNEDFINFILNNDKNVFKVVVLHQCGLSQEWIIDVRNIDVTSEYLSKLRFFVEFRYLQMSTISETIDDTSIEISADTINSKCVCYTDIELPNYGTYRKKLKVS